MTRKEALSSILQRAERAGWSGADPYDGLHSAVGRLAVPFGPPARLVVIQSALRLPWVRPLLGPRDSVNPKGLGLFLGAVVRGRAALGEERAAELACALVRELESRAQSVGGGTAWGYPFPWQSRFFFAPAGTPNAVVTSTVGWHLLAAAEAFDDPTARRLADAAAQFLQTGLHWSEDGTGGAAVSYTPLDLTRIVNVSGLVARLLARLGIRDRAERLTRYILASQLESGCWSYAPDRRGRWEDSFHTGFLLESLLHLRRDGIAVPVEALRRGFSSYRHFFDADGGARLYATPQAVHDAHSAAQGIVTYATAAEERDAAAFLSDDPAASAERIADWALRALWIPERGYFAYRAHDDVRDERDFIRWVQAWMALGLATAEALSLALRQSAGAESHGLGSIYDAHSAAQGMITYAAAAGTPGGRSLLHDDPSTVAQRMSEWSLRRLWIAQEGRFAHRWTPRGRDDTDYLRWVQAWMALGTAAVCMLVMSDANRVMAEQSA